MQAPKEEVVIDVGEEDNLSDTTGINLSNYQLKPPNQPPVTKRQKLFGKKKEEAMVAEAYGYLKSLKNSKLNELHSLHQGLRTLTPNTYFAKQWDASSFFSYVKLLLKLQLHKQGLQPTLYWTIVLHAGRFN